MFLWSFVAHEVLPLGEAGMHMDFPNDQAAVAAIQSSLGNNSGLYFFPGTGLGPNPTRQQIQAAMPAYEKKLETSASGLMVYHAPGTAPVLAPKTLATEFLTEFVVVLLTVILMTNAGVFGFGARMRFFILAGLLASLMTNVQYWNWYGFPTNYTLAQLTTWIIGFAVAGAAASLVLGKAAGARAAAAA